MELKELNPIKQLRLANPNELKQFIWEAQEQRNGRLINRINERYNEIMKYDY